MDRLYRKTFINLNKINRPLKNKKSEKIVEHLNEYS